MPILKAVLSFMPTLKVVLSFMPILKVVLIFRANFESGFEFFMAILLAFLVPNVLSQNRLPQGPLTITLASTVALTLNPKP